MTLILSVDELIQQPLQKAATIPWQAYSLQLDDPKQQSQGYRRSLNLRSGLNLLIDHYTLQDDLIVETERGELAQSCLELSFMLSGNNHTENVFSGMNLLQVYWDNGEGGRFHWQPGDRILKVDIHIDADQFEALIAETCERLPQPLQQGLADCAEADYRSTGMITPAMRAALHQLLECPYQGLTQRLYLESKVLELMAMRLEQLAENSIETQGKSCLRSHDIDCIYQAKEILLQNWNQPPSLIGLARQVGLNDYKLKVGFREVFGTTVFGYLHQYRMEQAKRLLDQRQMGVKEVGQYLGYSNPRCFADAFKKQFGMSPRAYITQKTA